MPEQEGKSTVMEDKQTARDTTPGERILDPASELPAPDSEAVAEPGGRASVEAGGQVPALEQADGVSRSEYDQLKSERDQLLDRLARLQAEFENARKRAEREKADYRDFATSNVVEQFLPVLDNFGLALKSKGTAEQLRSGVELIVKQMEEVLAKLQVTAVPAVGEEFDPRVHEALGTVERDDFPDQHIAEEIRRGYKLRERLLRPAMVRVAHNTKQVNE
jgi:molecular chaperone GrpE